MPEKTPSKEEKTNINVKLASFKGSQYSQFVGITMSNTELTLDFVYIHPNNEVKFAEIVSRVVLPHKAAKKLSKDLTEVIEKHEQKLAKKA